MRKIGSRVWKSTVKRRVKAERRKLWADIKARLIEKGAIKRKDIPLMDKIVKEVYLS